MANIVPSSKIAFTDFMVLLVAVLMGLNSIMNFEEAERRLPPVHLPRTGQQKTGALGSSRVGPAYITVRREQGGKRAYYYNDRRMTLKRLVAALQKNRVRTVVLRADRDIRFSWQEFCDLTWRLSRNGIRQLSYATNGQSADNPTSNPTTTTRGGG